MALRCGLNRWVSNKETHSGDGPTEEVAYQRAAQAAEWAISSLRWHYREDCPADCDGGRIVKWDVSFRQPYTWPGWKDGEEWWFAAVELVYDVAVLCLTCEARDALRLTANSAHHYRMDPYALTEDPIMRGEERSCESGLRLTFTTDYQVTGVGNDTDEAQRHARTNARQRAVEMLVAWAMRFRCASPCIKLLLLDDNVPRIVLRTLAAPWSAIASIEPGASLFCLHQELGPTIRARLIEGGFMSPEDAAVIWP